MHAQVHAAGGDLVQQRLPQVRTGLVEQLDLRLAAPAELVTEHGGKFQPARPATDDEDLVQVGFHGRQGMHLGLRLKARACRNGRHGYRRYQGSSAPV